MSPPSFRPIMAGAFAALSALALACDPAEPDPGVDPDPGASDVPSEMLPLSPQVSDEEIRSAEGDLILSLDQVPGSISVDDESEFGAGQRFVAAEPSPRGDWLAVSTGGVAHSAGWLLEMATANLHPAAFQYGGSLEIGPWSEDGRWVVFIHEGPAGDRTLSVADTDGVGRTVEAASEPVRVPSHDDLRPEDRMYQVEEWEGGILQFRLSTQRWTFDSSTGAVETQASPLP
ncbi:MAG: hypothetical protein EA422_06425 [Gemmatimonadales bacterium]|nr:MAG: hypothetical protein EA422_06425 [Gemmatimonadales bacterium]